MPRPKSAVPRLTISVRVPLFVVNASKDIPGFRKELERRAIELFEEWEGKEK